MANASPTPSFALTDTTKKTSLLLAPQAMNDNPHREPTAEPLSEADITAIRRRIHEMEIVSIENGDASSREKELADMVGPRHQKKSHDELISSPGSAIDSLKPHRSNTTFEPSCYNCRFN